MRSPESGKHKRVLFLDDEPSIIKMAESVLKSIGYEVRGVLSGAEALEVYRERREAGEKFDFLILDLTIKGGMGGQEVLEILNREFNDINAIATSGYSSDPVLTDPSRYGFKAAIKKPYTRNEIGAVLGSIGGYDV
jgi:CheY-like chemotaxis protein